MLSSPRGIVKASSTGREWKVKGKIHDSIDNPQSGILIVARDHSIFDSTLGQDTSDKNGFFE